MNKDFKLKVEEDLFKGPDKDVIMDIDILIRSRNRIIQIVSQEEGRVINRLRQLAKSRNRKILFWTCATGIFQYNEKNEREKYQMTVGGKPWGNDGQTDTNPMTFLDFIEVDDDLSPSKVLQKEKDGKTQTMLLGGGANYVFLDLPNFMPSTQNHGQMSINEIEIVRRIKDLKEVLCENDTRKTIIIISRDVFIPEDLKKVIPVIDWPLPNKEVIENHLLPLTKEIENAYERANIDKKFSENDISILSDSLLGLTLDEVTSTFRQSAVRNSEETFLIDSFVKYNINAKKDIIRKSRSGLEFYESKINIKDSVGGLSELKKWLSKRSNAYSKEALDYGLEYPKGLLVVGIPGNGKSLIAKAIANEWNKLLLKWDIGSIYSSLVGSSEANIRNAIQTAEATAPCLSGETKILTINGRKNIKEINPGDMVYSYINNGKIQKTVVKAVTIREYDNNYTLHTSDGQVTCTDNHLWYVYNKDTNRLEWLETRKLNKDIHFIAKIKETDITDNDNICYYIKNIINSFKDKINNKNGLSKLVISRIHRIDKLTNNMKVYDLCLEWDNKKIEPNFIVENGLISHNCLLWIDEIEKAFSGINSSDRSDGGTAARVFGTFIQWLSEKNSPVFVVATANRIDQLPAELVRKGRFDEIFYVDLPTLKEREEIIKIHLNKRNLGVDNFDIKSIAESSEDFTGAEIESIIKESMYTAFADNIRKVTTEDIINEAKNLVPLSLTMGEQIGQLRQWAATKAKWASERNMSKELVKKQLKENSNSLIEIVPIEE